MKLLIKKVHKNEFLTNVVCSLLLLDACFFYAQCQDVEPLEEEQAQTALVAKDAVSEKDDLSGFVIADIVVEGNKYIEKEAIIKRLPYVVGQTFDKEKSSQAIKNLDDLGGLRQIRLEGEKLDGKQMNLYVIVEEKKLLEKLDIKGNKALSTKTIKEKLNLEKLTTVDEETLRRIAIKIKKLYVDENKHQVNVTFQMIPNEKNPDKTTAIFTINEGPSSKIKFVNFVGNDHMPARKLRSIIFSRENWILNFMDGAGAYNEEMLDMDKHRLEYFYRDYGYLMAKVAKAEVEYSPNKRDISITFHIKEGNQFRIRDLQVVGDELYSGDELMQHVLLEGGKPFSQNKLVQTMTKIKDVYGESGYIYCDVYPQVKPDEETNEVDVTFHIERGKKLYTNRIFITGNKVTRDKVIRRQLDISEGDMITTAKLGKSEKAVEYLSFFENDSVKWKIHRISEELADLEMNVKEAKTGNLNFMLSYGTDQYNPTPSLRGTASLEKRNLFGYGWEIGGLVQADRHRLRRLEAHFFDPHLFDSNVSMGLAGYKRWDEFDQWTSLDKTPVQKVLGADARFGVWLPKIDKRLQLIFDFGVEEIKTNNPHVRPDKPGAIYFEPIVRREFQDGSLNWFGLELVKDTRDHQVYPKSGFRTAITSRIAIPALNNRFSYFRNEAEMSVYSTLIEKFWVDDALVLAMHAKLGNVCSLAPNFKPIPYKELFHMGGQTTVRGFVWGGIGPAWRATGDPLGAQNALLYNIELVFPLIPDYSMKAHLFYDAGAGWDTPKQDLPDTSLVKRDKFDLRHAVGFGLNLVKPVPAKIDWGFKLDRKKKDHESPSEFHLSMNYAW